MGLIVFLIASQKKPKVSQIKQKTHDEDELTSIFRRASHFFFRSAQFSFSFSSSVNDKILKRENAMGNLMQWRIALMLTCRNSIQSMQCFQFHCLFVCNRTIRYYALLSSATADKTDTQPTNQAATCNLFFLLLYSSVWHLHPPPTCMFLYTHSFVTLEILLNTKKIP